VCIGIKAQSRKEQQPGPLQYLVRDAAAVVDGSRPKKADLFGRGRVKEKSPFVR
jgi:hypothetical protein